MRGRHVLLVFAVLAVALYVRIRTSGTASAPVVAVPARPVSAAPAPVAPLPRELHRPLLDPAGRDPFALPQAAPPPLAPVARPPEPRLPPPPPVVPPAPPPLDLRFAGRMVAPDGTTSILVQAGEGSVLLRPGEVLASGYRVDAVDAQAVLFTHPAWSTQTRWDVPPAPPFETR